jgi:hypothetical protein
MIMKLSEGQPVALECKLSHGAFSGERVFKVKLADGDSYNSLTPYQFCWNDNGCLVEKNEPTTEISGMVAARIVDFDDHQVIVEVPDGEIIAVEHDTVKDRPTNIKPPVSKSYVSV